MELGDFSAEFIHVTHSIPDTVAIALRTPVGVIVHTGDFKFDMTPIDGKLSDIQTLARLGAEGVLLLISDSTNAARPGQTPSERSIYGTIDNIFQKTDQKLFLSTFSSSLHRIQQFVDLANIHRRLVAVTGRSLLNNIRIASELGYLNLNPAYLIDARDASMFKPNEVMILSTGSQGEHRSALALMALDNHPFLKVEPGDTVVISARIIPGNERAIGNVVNHLLRRGAKIYHEHNADVHVSGHGSSEDLKLMLNLLKPKFFIPVHGEYQNLIRHAELAESVGIPNDNIKVAEDGELIRLTSETCEVFGREEKDVPDASLLMANQNLSLRMSSYGIVSNSPKTVLLSRLLSCTAIRVMAVSHQRSAAVRKRMFLLIANCWRFPMTTLKQDSTLDR